MHAQGEYAHLSAAEHRCEERRAHVHGHFELQGSSDHVHVTDRENELTDSLRDELTEAAEGDVGARRARHTGQPAGNGLISTAGDDAALAGGRGHVGVWASPTLGARQPPAFGEEKGRHRPQHGGALLACAHDCKPA